MPRLAINSSLRRLLAASAINAVGTGLVLPLTLIYLHRVRGIPLPTTGLLLMLPGVIGLVVVPLSGAVMDRVGPGRVLGWALFTQALAQLGLAWAHTPIMAIPALILQGLGMSPTFPAFNTLLSGIAPDAREQQRAFAINFTVLNAGIGVGSLIGAAVVDVAHPATFQILFVANAATCVAEGLLLRTVRSAAPARVGRTVRAGGYRQVLANRALRRLLGLTFLLAMSGYAALDSGLPAYANVVARVSARVVALSLAANTLTIVVVQLFVLRLLRGRRRSRAIAAVGLIWAGSWALFATSALPGSSWQRSALVLVFAALFGVGETFMAPTVVPLTNTVAGAQVRGRVNALSSGMYSVAFVISPAISAGFISAGLGGVWVGLLCLGGVLAAYLAWRLGRTLPLAQDQGSDQLPVTSLALERPALVQ